jgi:trimethylamine:corrinoid methyltransferase-like protein
MTTRDKVWLVLVLSSLLGWTCQGVQMHAQEDRDTAFFESKLEELNDRKNFKAWDDEIDLNNRGLTSEKRMLEDAKRHFDFAESALLREILQK